MPVDLVVIIIKTGCVKPSYPDFMFTRSLSIVTKQHQSRMLKTHDSDMETLTNLVLTRGLVNYILCHDGNKLLNKATSRREI